MEPIAHIHTDFPTKFGVPRQSGLASALESTIIFEPEYRNPDALRGIEGFSHIWLIWQFDRAMREGWSPTVLPPKLGGKTRVGVFATRSPFRPNSIGLSSVRLTGVELHTKDGPVLRVSIWWTARRSLISSRIFPTPTATRTLWTPLTANAAQSRSRSFSRRSWRR